MRIEYDRELVPINKLMKLSLPKILEALPIALVYSEKDGSGPTVDIKLHCPRLILKDSTHVSVQVGRHLYCTPRNDKGPWTEVEVGFPSVAPPDLWEQYADDWEKPTETVYPYIPIELVLFFIGTHGGIDGKKTFEGYNYKLR